MDNWAMFIDRLLSFFGTFSVVGVVIVVDTWPRT